MNYKIGDKVNLAPTTPLIITNILAGSTRIQVKSPDNDICFWTSPTHLTPTNRAGCSNDPPHKSPQIGDIVIANPGARTAGGVDISNLIGYVIDIGDSVYVEWLTPPIEHWTRNAVSFDDLTVLYRPL